eukprot:COSAG01_NODE_9875_length_2296_cov_1.689842_2_plen_112_part_00
MGPQGRRSKQIMKETFQRQTPPLPADLPAGVGELLQRCVWQEEMDHGWTQQLVLSVDVEQAEASVEADRVKILEKIRAVEGGVIRVNKEVQEALWVAYTGRGLPAWQYRCS